MKKRSIWIIIAVMSIALIGIGALQMYWINWSIKLGKENLETNIQDALSNVSKFLAQQEQIEVNAITNSSNSREQRERLGQNIAMVYFQHNATALSSKMETTKSMTLVHRS